MTTLSLKKTKTPQQKPKKLKNQRIDAAIVWMKESYPWIFNDGHMMPIELGSGTRIKKTRPEHISRHALYSALYKLTHKYYYRVSVSAGGHRVKLDGTQGSEITVDQQQKAIKRLAAK